MGKEIRPQVLGSNVRPKLPVQADDQQLGDLQGWRNVVKPGSNAERRQPEQLGHRCWPWWQGRDLDAI